MVVAQRRGLTGRAVALGGVIAFLAIILAAPVHRYVTARATVTAGVAQKSATERQLAQLRQQMDQLNDPAYVEQLARSRLKFAMPGDTVYIVTRPGDKPTLDASAKQQTQAKVPGATWGQRLWGSVQAADGSTP